MFKGFKQFILRGNVIDLAVAVEQKALAALAQQRLLEQRVDDPLALEPFYLRRPSITSSSRKQPLLGKKYVTTDQHGTEREEGALQH